MLCKSIINYTKISSHGLINKHEQFILNHSTIHIFTKKKNNFMSLFTYYSHTIHVTIHVIHFLVITHKMAQISDSYKTGYLLVPSRFITEYCDTKTHHKTQRHQSREKTKPQHNPELPENSPKNSVRTV